MAYFAVVYCRFCTLIGGAGGVWWKNRGERSLWSVTTQCFPIFKSFKCVLKKLILVETTTLKSTKKAKSEILLTATLNELIWSKKKK